MITSYPLMALQTAINYALSLDTATKEKLIELDQKVLEIVLLPLNINFFIYIDALIFKLVEIAPHTPDTIIHSNVFGLMRLGVSPASKVRALFNDKMRITGDLELGLAIKQLFDNLDIDFEGQLAHFTGDIVAYQLGSWFRRGREIQQRLTSTVSSSVSAYVTEEVCWLPTRLAIADFLNDVDELALRVERLSANINLRANPHDGI